MSKLFPDEVGKDRLEAARAANTDEAKVRVAKKLLDLDMKIMKSLGRHVIIEERFLKTWVSRSEPEPPHEKSRRSTIR